MNTDDERLGELFRLLRYEADLTQEEIAIATARPTPTEGEIRDLVEGRLDSAAEDIFDSQSDLADALERLATTAADHLVDSAKQTEAMHSAWEGVRAAGDGLWQDLRPTEAARLCELIEAAAARVQARCKAIVIEEIVGAGVQFAHEFPEAPRSSPN
jgi:hypothetical protein